MSQPKMDLSSHNRVQSNQQQQQQQEQKPPLNLLIINPSPRKIKWFEAKLKILNTKYDIFRAKDNLDEVDAYKVCRDFFLEHTEYTHMAILPDDLLVDLRHVDRLVEDLEQFDYDVLSGISNFACTSMSMWEKMTCIDYKNYGAVDQLAKTGRFDYFRQTMTRKEYDKIKKDMENKPNRIIRVALSNFPFTVVKRSVVEQIEFGINLMGVDTVFFQSCIKKGIPTYADLDVQLVHLKGIEKNHELSTHILPAFEQNINTNVLFSNSKPAVKQEIFLPKVQQTTE
ncbi:MAG: hypothetical protein ACHQ1D_05065 [Nitrososphaerales archaeon]